MKITIAISLLLNLVLAASLNVMWTASNSSSGLPVLQGSFAYIDPTIEPGYLAHTHLFFDERTLGRSTYSKYQALGTIVEHGFVTPMEGNLYLLHSEHGDVERIIFRKDNDIIYFINENASILIFYRFSRLPSRMGFPSPVHLWNGDELFLNSGDIPFLSPDEDD